MKAGVLFAHIQEVLIKLIHNQHDLFE